MDNFVQQSPFNKARVDKFTLVLNLPTALKPINRRFVRDNSSINLDTIQFSIEGTVLPEIVVPAVETRHTGGNIYVSSHSRSPHPPVSVQFTIDNHFNNYNVIYQWLNLQRDEREGVYGIVNARKLASPEAVLKEYSTTFNLIVKNENNEPVMRFDYHNAFPTKLGSVKWDSQDSKEIVCTFDFVFSNITCTVI